MTSQCGKVLALMITSGLFAAPLAAQSDTDLPAPVTAQRSLAATAPAEGNLTKAQEQELLDFLKANESSQYQRLVSLSETSPATYHSIARSWYTWMESIKKYPPQLQKAYVLQQEAYTKVYRLMNDIRQATPQQRPQMTAELRTLVSGLLDAQMQVREFRLAQLEDQLKLLRDELRRTKDQREKLVDESVASYLQMAGRMAAPQPSSQPATTQPAK